MISFFGGLIVGGIFGVMIMAIFIGGNDRRNK